ncbi:MAG: B12-binding domain-containing radical SAM protein [Candidatus Eisenbacteria bacterium]|nr:B12-binding domain-containing radical SAM protein [Candidatus Eisenbacteria bacterium]
MKCLLTAPSWTYDDIRSATTKSVAGVWPMPGLMYIGAVLRRAGHEVRILESFYHTRQEMLQEIAEWKPDLFGVYSVALMWNRARDLIRMAKGVRPGVFTVAGGHGPTAFRTACFDEPALDAVVCGEGETTAVALAERVAAGANLEGLRGCIWRDGDRIVENPPQDPITNLDVLPFPAYDLVAHYPYRPSYGQVLRLPVVEMVSSRGCKNNCIYCFRMMGNATRYRSPGHVVDEMEWYVKDYGVREIKFWDEHFALDRVRTIGICEEILRRNLKIVFWCSARVDAVDEELLRMMKRAGCWCINYGMESGVDKNLKTPFPGTELYKNVHLYGHINAPLERLGMLFKGAPFVPYTMTAEQVIDLVQRAYADYYARPSFVMRRIARIREWYDVQALFFGGLSVARMRFHTLLRTAK